MTCFTKCLEHFKYLESKWKEGKCIMDTSFPCFDSYLVIDDSSGEEEEEEDDSEEENPKPSTSKAGSPPDKDVKNAINSAVEHFFKKNEHLFKLQVKLCDEYINEGISQCMADADALDKFAADLEDEMASLRNEIYGPYEPIITNLEPLDINELEENMEEEQEEVKMTQEELNKLMEEVKTPRESKRLKLDKSDKDDIITIDRTVCVVPANLPLEGNLEYPVVEGGQTIYAMKLTVKDPWYRGKVKNIVNEKYIHILFQTGEKLVKPNQIAYAKLNLVRFPVGCRVIAKFTDPNSKRVDEFYAGIVAEPPKMLNDFR